MPCMCWYDPPEESKKRIKKLCTELVEEILELQKIGDPIGYRIDDIHTLIDHLFDPKSCKERKGEKA